MNNIDVLQLYDAYSSRDYIRSVESHRLTIETLKIGMIKYSRHWSEMFSFILKTVIHRERQDFELTPFIIIQILKNVY